MTVRPQGTNALSEACFICEEQANTIVLNPRPVRADGSLLFGLPLCGRCLDRLLRAARRVLGFNIRSWIMVDRGSAAGQHLRHPSSQENRAAIVAAMRSEHHEA